MRWQDRGSPNNLFPPKKEKEKEKERQMNKQTMISQGYVPSTCTLTEPLAGILIWSEVNAGRDVCAGCNMDRLICKGRPKKETQNDETRTSSR